jgi:hypothetical protein
VENKLFEERGVKMRVACCNLTGVLMNLTLTDCARERQTFGVWSEIKLSVSAAAAAAAAAEMEQRCIFMSPYAIIFSARQITEDAA